MSSKKKSDKAKSEEKKNNSDWQWNFRFISLLAAVTILRTAFAIFSQLKYEEAYYWLYSQHLSLSYFDHPPLVGWLIYISTALFGSGESALRFPAIVCGAAVLYLIHSAASKMFNAKVGFIAACIAAALPAFELYSIFVMPDGPLLAFWCLGMYAGYRLYTEENKNWWLVIGAASGLACLAKYPGILTPLAVLLTIIITKKYSLFKCWQFPVSVISAAAIFSPVLIWNSRNNWVSLLYQGVSRFSEANTWTDKILGSAMNISILPTPLGLILLTWAVWQALKLIKDPKWLYLAASTVPFAVIVILVSFFRLIQLNWPLPVYPAAVIICAAVLEEKQLWTSLKGKIILGLVFIPAALISIAPLAIAIKPFACLNRVNELIGWKDLGREAVSAVNKTEHPEKCFIAGNSYAEAAQLAYYSGLQDRTLCRNIFGEKSKSFDFWSKPGDYKGWDCVYIVTERLKSDGTYEKLMIFDNDDTKENLKPYFESIDSSINKMTVFNAGRPVRRYRFYICRGYKGIPKEQH